MSGATLIVGAGLIGTSAGLALTHSGRRIVLTDPEPAALAAAVERGAGEPWSGQARVDHVLIAVPPRRTGAELEVALRSHLDATVMDVASVKSLARLQVETNVAGLERYVGSHPMAGNAGSGPLAAAADLFVGRTWALTPHPDSTPRALAAARGVVADCGATAVECDPDAHDLAVARASHLPQILASALASALVEAPDLALALTGPALRDMTRLAASPTALWRDILTLNRAPVAELVRGAAESLGTLAAGLDEDAESAGDAVARLLQAGQAGAARLPGRHSEAAERADLVVAVLKDEPGALAALLRDVAASGVNLEDLRIEHAPGAPLGSAQLAVPSGAGPALAALLTQAGWSASLVAEPGR